MKKILAVAVTLFMVFMSYVAIGGFIQKQQKENASSSTVPTDATPISTTTTTETFTIDQVASHSSFSDCWLIINDKVYSVGKFLGEHPGEPLLLLHIAVKKRLMLSTLRTKDRMVDTRHRQPKCWRTT